MENFEVVQGLQTFDHLNKNSPDVVLLELCFALLVIYNLLVEVSIISVVHYDAEELMVLQESVFVPNYIWVLNGGKNPHFV